MRMNRRNVLFVLGTTILLGGALIASGAFSQVEATRDVTVQTTGDADAALGIELNSSYSNSEYVSNGSGKAITIEFTDVNDNATIYFDDLINVTNNGHNPINVTVNASGSSGIMVYESEANSFENGSTVNVGELTSTGGSGSFGVAINTDDFDFDGDQSITIEANRA